MSTLRRHLAVEQKTGSISETIVQICRAYELNPVAALIASGLLEEEEVDSYTRNADFAVETKRSSPRRIIEQIHEQLDELGDRFMPQEERSELTRPDLHNGLPDPDYSNMSAEDAKAYGLAAKSEDEHIAHDELPNQP